MRRAIRKESNSRVLIARGLAFILLSSLGLLVFGDQDASKPNPQAVNAIYQSDTTIMVRSDLVLIPVTVTDGSGRVVPTLEKEHFTIFEDKTRQEITHFACEDTPVSIGIVFDASDSMLPKLETAREAVNNLLSNANPADEFFLVRFSTEARVLVPMTSRVDDIRNQVGAMRMGGSTSLLDGVRLGMAQMKHARYSRKALIIISDGDDNTSQWTVRELKAAVREQDILMYAIGIGDSGYSTGVGQALNGAALLNEIATHTGGRLFMVKKLKELPEIAYKIGDCLRKQYMLGYMPNNSEKDGTYRRIRLQVSRPKGYPRLHAVWRQGYYAPRE